MSQQKNSNAHTLATSAGLVRANQHETMFESLEPRVLLSTSAGVETILWAGGELEARAGSWIMTFERSMSDAENRRLAQETLASIDVVADEIESLGRGRYARVQVSESLQYEHVMYARGIHGDVKGFEPDIIYATAAVPNDPLLSEQWHLSNTGQSIFLSGPGVAGADISVFDAWDLTKGSPNVIIAVIDTGVDLEHPDLSDNIWVNPNEIPNNGLDDDANGFIDDVSGWDFGEGDNNADDSEGHGTAVAGLIGATGNNGVGVSGVNWTVGILPLKIADRFGSLSTAAIISSHDYATLMIEQGHNIVASNNSYGGYNQSFYANAPTGFDAERDAIERFIDAGGTFVAAAGNESHDNDDPQFTSFPATYNIPGLISVAATDNNDGLAGYSNYGASTVDIGAPAVDTYTTRNGGGYEYFNGTSAASPVVAGVVGLIKAYKPNASPVEIREALLNSSDPIPSLQGKVVSGGRLNALRALQIVGLNGPVVRSFDPGPVAVSPVSTMSVTFNEKIDPTFLTTSAVEIRSAGVDGVIGTIDDIVVPASSVTLSTDGLTATVTPSSLLVVNNYRLTIQPSGFRDLEGNFLNGNGASGTPSSYDFSSIGVGANFEPNDRFVNATPVSFNANSEAVFQNIVLGDGPAGPLDVDIYRIDLPRGGLITADIDAKELTNPSTLDSYLRLFDASGNELANNDQFHGQDSYLDYFVTTGGTYYIGVSGFPNDDYNPEVLGSGTSQETGPYKLTLRADLIADDTIITPSAITTPVSIPDQGAGTLTNSVTVLDDRLVLDANVVLNVDHPFVGDLRVSLRSPEGTVVRLMNQNGGSNEFQAIPSNPQSALFDDEAVAQITNSPAPYSTGQYQPATALSDVDGESAFGTWTLIIEDLSGLNTGTLIDWTLELHLKSDIFGPFELNDTLSTSRSLTEINGSGSASRTALIGDGGFGLRDVDIFSFVADAGSTLNARVDAQGSFDSALQLLNSQGQVIKLSNPSNDTDSAVQNFVFAEGGLYYLAISEANNTSYSPIAGGSGDSALTTGDYTLNVDVTPGVSDGSVTLSGDLVSIGVDSSGVLNSGSAGASFQGVEFLYRNSQPSLSTSYFGLVASGSGFRNDGTGGSPDLPMSIIDQSSDALNRVLTRGVFRGIDVSRSISFADDGSYAVFDVRLVNNSGSVQTDVAWMEAFNPQQGLNLVPNSALTDNDIVNDKPFVTASYASTFYPNGLTVGFGAVEDDARALATTISTNNTTIRDPGRLLEVGVDDPNGNSADRLIAMAYDVGIMDVGTATTLRYYMMFGSTTSSVLSMYDTLNAGTGEGLLAKDRAAPALDTSGLPSLPYEFFYPEGYANGRASTFVPIVNPNSEATRVVVIARYETGTRDEVIYDDTIAANSRGGLTITTPEMYDNNTLIVRKDTPYALEIRSELPVGATMSHYDFTGSTGENFTSTTSNQWSFADVRKGGDSRDFIVFQNTTDVALKVTTTFYRANGGQPIEKVYTVAARRRGGWNVNAETDIPDGNYAVTVTAVAPIVAAVTSFNEGGQGGSGSLGVPSIGSLTGALPQGQYGLNSAKETISILNANNGIASVALTFAFDNGSTYRSDIQIAARSRADIDVSTLVGFPTGRSYAVEYESNVPVSLSSPTEAFGDVLASSFTTQSATYWLFAEGFRPTQAGLVSEYLRVYNPNVTDTLMEIEMQYSNGETESYRRTVAAGRVSEFDVHEFVSIARRTTNQFYSIAVKSADGVVAFFGHSDDFFPGAFGTLGTPFGIRAIV